LEAVRRIVLQGLETAVGAKYPLQVGRKP